MTKKPLVSLIIPVYNSASTLDECIERVVKQTYQNWEIVIVDSNSSDETGEIAAKWRKKLGGERFNYCNIKIRSRTRARNFGVAVCKGNRIFVLDSDNFLPKDFLEECAKKIIGSDYDGLRPYVKEIWMYRNYLARCWYYLIHGKEDEESKERPYPNFLRRDVWLKLNGQNEELEFGEDLEFAYRFERAGYYAPQLEKPVVMHNMPFYLKSILFKTSFSSSKKFIGETNTIQSKSDRTFLIKRISFMLKNPKYALGMIFLSLVVIIGRIAIKINY